MNISEMKSKIHNKIDEITDPELLQHYYDILDIDGIDISGDDFWDKLTEEQRQDIEQAYLDAEDETGQITHEEMMKKMSEWLTK